MINIHIDLDTPHVLNRFYHGEERGDIRNDEYCSALLNRAKSFFDDCEVKATFFVITKDLELESYTSLLKELFHQGHEIASHTHSHPYVSSDQPLDLVRNEVRQSYQAIESTFNTPPIGFRSPGFFINRGLINILKNEGFKYDCSSSNFSLAFILKLGALIIRGSKIAIGRPKTFNLNDQDESFKEFPLPSCLGLPYYNNLNLYLPFPIRDFMVSLSAFRRFTPYLFHLIEFADFDKDKNYLPPAIHKHPNLKTPLAVKMKYGRKVILNLKKQGEIKLTKDCL